jgi:hypothetical protein
MWSSRRFASVRFELVKPNYFVQNLWVTRFIFTPIHVVGIIQCFQSDAAICPLWLLSHLVSNELTEDKLDLFVRKWVSDYNCTLPGRRWASYSLASSSSYSALSHSCSSVKSRARRRARSVWSSLCLQMLSQKWNACGWSHESSKSGSPQSGDAHTAKHTDYIWKKPNNRIKRMIREAMESRRMESRWEFSLKSCASTSARIKTSKRFRSQNSNTKCYLKS